MMGANAAAPAASPRPLGTGLRALLWVAVLGVAAVGSGCKDPPVKQCPRFEAAPWLAPSGEDPVVAEVNGRPILGSAVAHRARTEGLTPRAALEALVDEELLVQEAERRGLARDPEVVHAAKQAAVYALLRDGFEQDYTAASVPEADLVKLYRINERAHFRRPEVRRFSHLYATRPGRRVGRRWIPDREADARLHALFERLHAAVKAAQPKTWREFEALRNEAKDPAFPVLAQRGTMSKVGLQQPFADILYSMKPGEVSGVITTSKFVHIAFLVKIIGATNISYEQARSDILARRWPEARRQAFRRLVSEARGRCEIVLRPEHLPVSPEGQGAERDPGPERPAPARPKPEPR